MEIYHLQPNALYVYIHSTLVLICCSCSFLANDNEVLKTQDGMVACHVSSRALDKTAIAQIVSLVNEI